MFGQLKKKKSKSKYSEGHLPDNKGPAWDSKGTAAKSDHGDVKDKKPGFFENIRLKIGLGGRKNTRS